MAWSRHLVTLRAWRGFIERDKLSTDEFTPPPLNLIDIAIETAEKMQSSGRNPPDHIVLDGQGGIEFEWDDGKSRFFIDGTTPNVTGLDRNVIREDFG